MPTKEEISLEIEKCKQDPYYFFSTYVLINGKKTTMTRDEFDMRVNIAKHFSPIKRRTKH